MFQLESNRGIIYDRNMRPMVANLNVGSLYVSPREVKEPAILARKLAKMLNMEEGRVLEKLESDSSFVWLKRKMDYERASGVMSLGAGGVGVIKETKRFYPNSWLASHVIGFTNVDGVGLEGLETAFDGYISGTSGWSWTVRDAKARKILSRQSRLIPPCDGYNLVLAIDEVIQHIAEKELDYVYKKFKAKGGSVIVMNPHNGDILALANRPTFDPNDFNASPVSSRRNRVVTDMFEPGSVFKIVAASAALEEGKASLDDTFFCEEGAFRIANHTLHDHKPHGELTFKEVIALSSNIGTVKIAQLLDEKVFFNFIKSFGFGAKTGVDLPGEVDGIARSPKNWSGTSIAAIPIGQEIAVTPIQLVSAISAIANGGRLMKPRIVLEVQDKAGGVVKSFAPTQIRRAVSDSTASLMREVLTAVVEEGTGKNARLSEYTSSGKTGTAQKIKPGGGYSHSKFVASFIGFAPAKNPEIAILVCIDEPGPVYYGGSVAAPAFKKIAEGALRYLKVRPDRELVARR